MTQFELSQVVDQMMNEPKIEACVVCSLTSDQIFERHRPQSRILSAVWREQGDFWRCTVTTQPNSGISAAQVDVPPMPNHCFPR